MASSSSYSYLSRLSRTLQNTLGKVRDPFGTAIAESAVEGGVGRSASSVLFDFGEEHNVRNWRTASDAVFGGYSRGELQWVEDDGGDPSSRQPFLRFSGVYSRRIDPARVRLMSVFNIVLVLARPDALLHALAHSRVSSVRSLVLVQAHPNMKRSGFVSMSGRPLDSLDSYIDLESYRALRFTVRIHENSVHRTFLANVRSDNWVTGGQMEDVWQAVLHDGNEDGSYTGWKEVEVPLEGFTLTWRGRAVGEKVEMGRSKVMSVGIGLLGGDEGVEEEGQFCLDLRRVEGVGA